MSVTSEMLVLSKLCNKAKSHSLLQCIINDIEVANIYVRTSDYDRLHDLPPSETIREILSNPSAKYELHSSYEESFFDSIKDEYAYFFGLYKKEILEVLNNEFGQKIHPNNKCCKIVEWQEEQTIKVAKYYLSLVLKELEQNHDYDGW